MSNNELYHHGILGQKWGRRRYQNPDGSYTQAGMNRYNKQKTHKYGIATTDSVDLSYMTKNNSYFGDSSKKTSSNDSTKTSTSNSKTLTKDDIKRYQRAVDAGSKAVKQLSDYESQTAKKTKKKRMDLSEMSDTEMKEKINREVLERRYNDLFNETTEEVSTGRSCVKKVLGAAGGVLAVTGSALSVALAIKELKG